jgi:hypothetical protein
VSREPTVFVVSDSMGETAQLVARAALSQFQRGAVELHRFGYIDTVEAAKEVVTVARTRPSLIIFTLIIPEVREYLKRACLGHRIPAVDIMGPALDGLEEITGHKAFREPGLIHRLDEQYFSRVEAVEFAVNHDDGKDPEGYRRAEVILLGVSRTSKTPVCMYLANKGVRAANLPMVPEVPIPPELHRVPVHKLVGLTISPPKLLNIREQRIRAMGVRGDSDYADIRRIQEELSYADRTFRELGCEVVNVTDRAIEETAVMILDQVRARRRS